jgi:hypothetical protein
LVVFWDQSTSQQKPQSHFAKANVVVALAKRFHIKWLLCLKLLVYLAILLKSSVTCFTAYFAASVVATSEQWPAKSYIDVK